jgi:hypothetical protein
VANPLLRVGWNRARKSDNNWIVLVVGAPGSGKSLWALQAGWLLDRGAHGEARFSMQNVVYTAKQFMTRINAPENVKKPGRVIIWEEPYAAGLKEGGANSRQFMRKVNLQIATIFGTMRKNNHIIFLTLPLVGALDLQAREVCHGMIWVKGNSGDLSWAVYNERTVNPFNGKTYTKRLRFKVGGTPFDTMNILSPKPPQRLFETYKEISDLTKSVWAKEISQDLDAPKKEEQRTREKKLLLAFAILKRNPSVSMLEVERKTGLPRETFGHNAEKELISSGFG